MNLDRDDSFTHDEFHHLILGRGQCHPPRLSQGRKGRPTKRRIRRLHQSWRCICQVPSPGLPQTNQEGQPPHAPAGILLPPSVYGQVPQTDRSLPGAKPHFQPNRDTARHEQQLPQRRFIHHYIHLRPFLGPHRQIKECKPLPSGNPAAPERRHANPGWRRPATHAPCTSVINGGSDDRHSNATCNGRKQPSCSNNTRTSQPNDDRPTMDDSGRITGHLTGMTRLKDLKIGPLQS